LAPFLIFGQDGPCRESVPTGGPAASQNAARARLRSWPKSKPGV